LNLFRFAILIGQLKPFKLKGYNMLGSNIRFGAGLVEQKK